MISGDIFVFYISTVLLAMVVIICNRLLTEEKLKTNYFVVIIVFLISFGMVANNLNSSPVIKSVIGYLLASLLLSFVYRRNIKIATLDYLVIWAIINILDTLISVTLSLSGIIQLGLSPTIINIIKVTISLLESLLLFIVVRIKSVRKCLINIKKLIANNTNYLMIIVMFLIISLVGVYNFIEIYHSIDNIVVVIVMGLVLIVIFYLIKLKTEETFLENKNKYLNDANEFYNKLVEGFSMYHHNVNNQFLAIRAVANEEVKELIDDNLKFLQNNSGYLPLFQKAPKGIKEVFYVKFASIDHEKILINIMNECDDTLIDRLSLKKYNALLEAIGIAIDNAIEAECDEQQKIINIDICSNNDRMEFCITNTFSNSINVERLGLLNYTTKIKGHGIGLYYLLKHKTIHFENKILNNKFQVKLSIQIKN